MNTGTVLSGSLKDFGLVEVLQIVEMGGMTGAIHLKQSNGRMGILYFNEGKLANCSEFDPSALTLGDVLQQLGMTTYHHIEQAYMQQLQDPIGKRIGERLIAMGAITEDQLQQALKTKVLWTARELALWNEGNYEFIASPNVQKLLPHGEISLDIDVLRITMEMVHYGDEWQTLRQFLPQGMRTMLQLSPAIPFTIRFDLRALELFTHVNLYRRVRRIATAIRRPELEVAQDLAQLVQQKFLLVAQQEAVPPSERNVRLPDPAEKLRLENFALLDLISRMEQEWDKRRTPMDQLPALAEFVNWTMDALAELQRSNGLALDPNALKSLMMNEGLTNVGNYEFKVEHNHVDVENFTSLCYEIMSGDVHKAEAFYDQAAMILHRLLCCIFEMINARVANPRERLENQEVWEAMFEQFALQSSGA
ncbi:uncharacterized protein DUF4388 [Thermosporothrix hazakensis]|jgi:hypothetical protein|uniref:Uncharacterized protein DUF4388 n=2 Tax=Thermosporothrix TaxID=768650 RepID=A0A326U3L2_THEHA|nr:DUF4388 domain-containing protein [Thermosporothrix hazakensis]PZW26660.1 uncharacterized protein DUF4388 [Thermosporothrix hazakensis]BBH89454.1 hypothetical protein KTC_42050 [Thermosporothrix sp. COM3]GCE47638.1 hypothetical protein KTH_25070 [Thermosporothrix hazakensis]